LKDAINSDNIDIEGSKNLNDTFCLDIDFEKRVDDATLPLRLQLDELIKVEEQLRRQSLYLNNIDIEKIAEKIAKKMGEMIDKNMAELDKKMDERYERMLKMVNEYISS
jgi:hypothetical protein